MKKLLCMLLTLALCACILSGCGRKDRDKAPSAGDSPAGGEAAAGTTPVPEVGEHGEVDQSAALEGASGLDEMPTLAPAQTVPPGGQGDASEDYFNVDSLIEQTEEEFETYDETPKPANPDGPAVLDANVYQYSSLVDTSLGFTFNYPSNWDDLPGVFTVCYRERVEPGDFPARIAITAKKLVHSPEGTVLSDELTSYMKTIYRQYDPDSFQVGTVNSEDTFLGRQAVSNTYLAFSGDTEVKGFVIARSVKRTLYVLHFCASYDDYIAMENIMRYMVKSVQLIDDEKK